MKKFLLILITCVMALGLYAQIPAGDAQPCPGTPTVTDHEGNVYNTVRIGNQCWTKENLRTTTSPSTGTYLIPPAGTNSTYTGKQAFWYNNDPVTYAPMNYGLLYNWNAAVDTFNTTYGETSVNTNFGNAVSVTFNGHRRGICPEGWHVPSEVEWSMLENYLKRVPEYQCGGRSNYIAKALAFETGWDSDSGECFPGDQSGTANNTTGFSAVPAGSGSGSRFDGDGGYAHFCSSSQYDETSTSTCKLFSSIATLYNDYDYKDEGLSVRCLRDVPIASQPAVGDAIPCPGVPTVKDHENNVYNTVKIGNQCWTKENLRTTSSPSTGTYIIPPESISCTHTGKQARWYNNDSATYAPMNYGLLYNWNAAVDTFNTAYGETSVNINSSNSVSVSFSGYRRGICPIGWHLPSDEEWTQLLEYMQNVLAYQCGNGSIGKALASETGWNNYVGYNEECSPGDQSMKENNTSGFSALPAGYSQLDSHTWEDIVFNSAGSLVEFWSSTESAEYNNEGHFYEGYAYSRYISNNNTGFSRFNNEKLKGYSVRCLRDPGPFVYTDSVLGVTTSTATCGGEVVDDGGTDVIARGVCWSTSHNPTVANAHTSNGTGVGTFTSSITGLASGTTYYVRAYATNSEGTAYGEEVSFFTACPTPNDISASGITAESATINWNGSSDSYLVRYRTPAQVYFKEDFENGLPSTWTTIDQDGDGHNWSSYSNTTVPAHSGTESVASESFDLNAYAALSPDNWLITPKIDLQGVMKVWLRSEDPDYPNEHFAIYLSTTGNAVSDFTTTLVGETISTSTYTEYSADLSNYAGQQGYVAIRHFNCRDMFKLVVDDFGLYEADAPVWHTVTSNTNSASLTGLIPGTPYEVQVQGVCAEYNTDWSDTLRFFTNCRPEDQCELTFVLTDSYGDSWNGNAILVKDAQTGVLLGYMTNEDMDGLYEPDETTTMPLALCNGRTVNFEWVEGGWPQETSYAVYDGNGEEIFSGAGGFTEPFSYTVTCENPCTAISLPYFENFDSYTTSTTASTGMEPICWNLVQEDVTMTSANRPQLYYNSSFAHSGSYSLRFGNRGVYAMPELDETVSVNTLKLEMYLRQPKSYDALQVGVWDGQLFVPVATFNNSGTGVTYVECDFSGYIGNGRRIAFRNVSGDGVVRNTSYNYLDDIVLTTACESITLPYSENFDGFTTSTTASTGVEPICWNLVQEDVTMTDANRPQLYYNSGFAHSGSYSLRFGNRGVYAMPELDETVSLNTLKLEMYLRQPKSYDALQVGVWDGQQFVPVATFNNSGTGVEFVECDFSTYTGNGRRIAFRNVSADNTLRNTSYNYLDDIVLTTACESITLPYSESFDDFTNITTASTGVEPTCWELVQEDVQMTEANRPQLYYNSSFASSGSYSLRFGNRGVYAMPELDETVSVNTLKLEMYLRQPKSYDALQVGVWDGQQFVPVATFNNSGTGVEFVECDFSRYNGNGRRIAFRNVSADNTVRNTSYNYLDDIQLTQACGISEVPYSESFDDFTNTTTASTGVEPTCWELVQEDVQMTEANRPQLYYNSSFAHSGSYSLRFGNRGVYAMPALDEAVSVNTLKLSMYLRQPKSYDALQVGVWDGQQFVPVATFNNSGTGVTYVECNFSGYSGNGRRIAFRNVSADNTVRNTSYNYLDDITLGYACGIYDLPYTENFDSYTTSTTAETGVQPDCWEVVTEEVALTNATKPQIYRGYATSGSYSLRMKNRCVLAMPELDENINISDLTLTMKLRQPKTIYRLQVGMVDGQGTFKLVKTLNNTSTSTEDVTVSFANYTGHGRRIAFRNTLVSGSTLDYSINYIDDINLSRTTNKSMEVTDADAGMLDADRDMVDVVVYPNPTKEFVNVQCTMNNVQGSMFNDQGSMFNGQGSRFNDQGSNVQCSGIEVVDVYGKVVRTVVGANNDSPTQINVSGLAAGMYFVRVTTDRGVVTRPFVKR